MSTPPPSLSERRHTARDLLADLYARIRGELGANHPTVREIEADMAHLPEEEPSLEVHDR